MTAFERGFKSWCENVSAQIRGELELTSSAPLPCEALADYLGVALWVPEEIEGLQPAALSVLKAESDSWSAVTVSIDGKDAVVYNSAHRERRTSNDVTHELAHILAGHPPATVVFSADGGMALRTFNRAQEDEANWLSGSLLLPRDALVLIARSRRPASAVCDDYRVSEELLQYRMNVTGVRKQFRQRTSATPQEH